MSTAGSTFKRPQTRYFHAKAGVFLALGIVTVGSSGCAGLVGSAASKTTTSTSTAPALTITPATVSFGNVAVGSTNSQTIQMSNTGSSVLTISQLSATGSGFKTSTLSMPLSLNPGATSAFNAQFSPSSAGATTGTVSIVSNDPASPQSIGLTGTGVTATLTLSFSANSLNFGSVDTGTSSSQSVTVTNTGNSAVQISQIAVTGTGFTLTAAGTPVSVAAGQSFRFAVIFAPTAATSSSGTVTVTSNAAGSPASIALSGTGVLAVQHSVLLDWTASASPSAIAYNVYRSLSSGSGYVKLNPSPVPVVTYTDGTVQNAKIYFYVTTALDANGDESIFSNEIQMSIP